MRGYSCGVTVGNLAMRVLHGFLHHDCLTLVLLDYETVRHDQANMPLTE